MIDSPDKGWARPSDQAGRATPRARKRSRPYGDHPSRSMVPYGPEHPDYPNAPRDWDGGPYLCRDGGLYHMRGYGWEHGLGCWNPTADWDRIAYHTRDNVDRIIAMGEIAKRLNEESKHDGAGE